MNEVSTLSLFVAAFTIVAPFLILVSIMFTSINRAQGRIEARLDGISDKLSDIIARVSVLEDRGDRPQPVDA